MLAFWWRMSVTYAVRHQSVDVLYFRVSAGRTRPSRAKAELSDQVPTKFVRGARSVIVVEHACPSYAVKGRW